MPRLAKRQHAGFTLIELLVVIAIIAILIALLVPAVQKVRFAAARTQSTNNLKQLALASHSFHDQNKWLPFNGTGVLANVANMESGSWAFQILPYLDQDVLYQQQTGTILASWGAPLAVYRCPMRDRPGYVNAAAGSAPAPVPGPSAISNAGGAAAGGVNNNSGPTTDYALNPYINNPTIPASTVNSANSKRKLNTITDGTSNTIMIGHAYVAVADYRLITPQATYRLPIFNGGVLANARPGVGDALTWLRDGAAITNNQWGSPMPDGGLMAMADGTVRIFPYGMNLQNFLTPTDGIAVTLP